MKRSFWERVTEREAEICKDFHVTASDLTSAYAQAQIEEEDFKEATLEREENLQSKLDDLEEELRQAEIDHQNALEDLEEDKNAEISNLEDTIDNLTCDIESLEEELADYD